MLDRRLGRRSGWAVPDAAAEAVERPYRERYAGLIAKHFHEPLCAIAATAGATDWTKSYLQNRGLLAKAPRHGAHRRKRPRRPLIGVMLHQAGSPHSWLGGRSPLDLVVTMDDASGPSYSAILVEEEGTKSSFLNRTSSRASYKRRAGRVLAGIAPVRLRDGVRCASQREHRRRVIAAIDDIGRPRSPLLGSPSRPAVPRGSKRRDDHPANGRPSIAAYSLSASGTARSSGQPMA